MRSSLFAFVVFLLLDCTDHNIDVCYTGNFIDYYCCAGVTLISLTNSNLGKDYHDGTTTHTNVIMVPGRTNEGILSFKLRSFDPDKDAFVPICYCLMEVKFDLPLYVINNDPDTPCDRPVNY